MVEAPDHIERTGRWREAFADNATGIRMTVDHMLWNYAAFQTAVKIVHLAGDRQGGMTGPNRMLFDLMAEGYWPGLLLGTRRLVDKSPLTGPRGVNSIRAVIEDVEKNRSWLNRRVYVEQVQRAIYDTDQLRQEEIRTLTAATGLG